METKYDVIALGELLIDFNQAALNDNGNYLYEAAAGGAPCNVLSMLQKLGRKTAFIGKVGKDSFGEYLKETIEDIGINTGQSADDKCGKYFPGICVKKCVWRPVLPVLS